MIIGTLMALETCLIFEQVSHNLFHSMLFYSMKKLLTDAFGPGRDGQGNGVPKAGLQQVAARGSPNLRVCKHPTPTGWHMQGGEG